VDRFPVEASDLALFATYDENSTGVLFLELKRSGPDADHSVCCRGYERVGLHRRVERTASCDNTTETGVVQGGIR
jgi:hypothetical protein